MITAVRLVVYNYAFGVTLRKTWSQIVHCNASTRKRNGFAGPAEGWGGEGPSAAVVAGSVSVPFVLI